VDIAIGCPHDYRPEAGTLAQAKASAASAGTKLSITDRPKEAVADADLVYTDVWTSMGQEAETEQRLEVFPPFQLNARLLKHARPDALVMHCLPAHRGEEITDDVLDGPQSVVYDEAENRLHVQKALLALLLGGA
jgi:ornithine carbamoyltransferase